MFRLPVLKIPAPLRDASVPQEVDCGNNIGVPHQIVIEWRNVSHRPQDRRKSKTKLTFHVDMGGSNQANVPDTKPNRPSLLQLRRARSPQKIGRFPQLLDEQVMHL